MPSIRRVRPDVPEELERVLVTALAKAPRDRLPTAEALGAALMPFASAEGVAGPFSLRPSQRDFALASTAMARRPSSPRISDATELLGLPSSRVPVCHTVPSPPPRSVRSRRSLGVSRDALRTFAGTLVVGMGLASAVTVVLSRSARTPGALCGTGVPCSISSALAPTVSASARAVRALAEPWAVRSSAPVPRASASGHASLGIGIDTPLAVMSAAPAIAGSDAELALPTHRDNAPTLAPLEELASGSRAMAAPSSSVPTGAPHLVPHGGQGSPGAEGHRPRRRVPPAPYL
jgi:hypothetical protein